MKTEITSSDIYFVAALLSIGAKIEEVDKTDTRHIKFRVQFAPSSPMFASVHFPETTSIKSVGLEFYETLWLNGTMLVNAIQYKNAIQQVKTIVHST